MFWSGSQTFWRPLPGCCAPFPSAASGRAARGLCALSLGSGAPYPSVASGSGGQRFACSLSGWGVPFPSAASGPGSQGFGALSAGAPCLFPPQPQRAPPVGSQEVFRQEPGPVCGGEGVASLGLSFPLSPPPARYLQRGWGGSSLEFLSPFVLQTAGGVFRLVNFSLALPQFKKISLRLLSGPSGRSLP